MLTLYLIGVGLTVIIYLASHDWSVLKADWVDLVIVLLWPASLTLFLFQLYYEKDKNDYHPD